MTITSVSETAIFERIALPVEPELSRQLANYLLALRFGPEDEERMQVLAEKARDGSLTPSEKAAIDNYERVGHYLAILQSKARQALRADHDS